MIKSYLKQQVDNRAVNYAMSRESWDTFPGWKRRGKNISKGSEGFKVELVVPIVAKENKKEKIEFVTTRRTLFNIKQTKSC